MIPFRIGIYGAYFIMSNTTDLKLQELERNSASLGRQFKIAMLNGRTAEMDRLSPILTQADKDLYEYRIDAHVLNSGE